MCQFYFYETIYDCDSQIMKSYQKYDVYTLTNLSSNVKIDNFSDRVKDNGNLLHRPNKCIKVYCSCNLYPVI